MTFLAKLARLIDDHGTSQAAVERAAGLPQNRIAKWRHGHGEADASQALRIARLFGVDVEWLADDNADWPPRPRISPEDQAEILQLIRTLGLSPAEAIRALAAVEPAATM
jgi:transcriptional regulator with XRE-family HTH domain